MPRRPRRGLGGYVLHVLNRGARRGTLFTSHGDYAQFERILAEAIRKFPIDLYEYCLMPNHFHLVLRPPVEKDLRCFMHWMTTKHAMVWRLSTGTVGEGAVYQGRYRAIAVETESYFLTLCRYVARNPVRAGLVKSCGDWRWSSAGCRGNGSLRLARWPIPKPQEWGEFVNCADDAEHLEKIRYSVNRGCPLGNRSWQEETAKSLGIQRTLRPYGRDKATEVTGGKN